jgi:hypothetical protein
MINYDKVIDCLDWEFLCNQCPEVLTKWSKMDRYSEYGMNWYEFINTENLYDDVLQWIKTVDKKDLLEWLHDRRSFYIHGLNRVLKCSLELYNDTAT